MKKFICIILCLSLFLTLSPISYAADVTFTENVIFSGSFIDSEGVATRIDRIRRPDGSEYSKEYYDGKLCLITSSTMQDNNAHITTTDVENNVTSTDIVPLSNALINTSTHKETPTAVRAPKYFMGQIHYNTLYADGIPYTLQLGYYQQKISTQDVVRVLNSQAGKSYSYLVELIAVALAAFCAIKFNVSYALVHYLVQKAGIAVVESVIQEPINEQYLVRMEYFDISVIDPDTSREQHFDGVRYRPLVDNAPVTDYQYEEFMPWNNTNVAYWLFTSFWPFSYPGVNRFA